MRLFLIMLLTIFGILAHAEPLAPYSCGAREAYAVDVGGGAEGALGYGFAVASAETGVGIAAGVGDAAKVAYRTARSTAEEVGRGAIRQGDNDVRETYEFSPRVSPTLNSYIIK